MTRTSSVSDVVFKYEPLTDNQKLALELFNKKRILFMLGPAGTGKSLTAMGLALKYYFETKKVNKIYLTRPCVEACSESLGYLPGDLDEKVLPYLQPYYQAISKLVYGNLPKTLFEAKPLAYLRGFNFENCVALLDESQNCTKAQLKLFLSRLGRNSKIIVTADPTQSDIRQTCSTEYDTDIEQVVDQLDGHPSVGIVDFQDTDIVRDPILSSLLKRLT